MTNMVGIIWGSPGGIKTEARARALISNKAKKTKMKSAIKKSLTRKTKGVSLTGNSLRNMNETVRKKMNTQRHRTESVGGEAAPFLPVSPVSSAILILS